MENVLSEVSRMLGTTVEELINYYPILQKQLVIYDFLDIIGVFILVAMIIDTVVFIFMSMVLISEVRDNGWEYMETETKVVKMTGIALITMMIILSIIMFLMYKLAPDIMMIKQLL